MATTFNPFLHLAATGHPFTPTDIPVSSKIRRKWLFTCSLFKCSFHGSGVTVKVILQLKMFPSIVSLCVPNFRSVTRSAQFSRNFQLCHRTTGTLLFTIAVLFVRSPVEVGQKQRQMIDSLKLLHVVNVHEIHLKLETELCQIQRVYFELPLKLILDI